jgi:hypothetical protein
MTTTTALIDNNRTGDAHAALYIGADGEPYLATNADPTPVAVWTRDSGDLGEVTRQCTMAEAAETLGVTEGEVESALRAAMPEADFAAVE